MKKLLILLILSTLLLNGCAYSLNIFVLPSDTEFCALVEKLDTPRKICRYMLYNFTFEPHAGIPLTPYQLYILRKGDCDDFSNFAVFVANYHGYETYQIAISYENICYNHCLAIYKEDGKYNFSDNQTYIFVETINFREIVDRYNFPSRDVIWLQYIVYDYNMNIVEQVIR